MEILEIMKRIKKLSTPLTLVITLMITINLQSIGDNHDFYSNKDMAYSRYYAAMVEKSNNAYFGFKDRTQGFVSGSCIGMLITLPMIKLIEKMMPKVPAALQPYLKKAQQNSELIVCLNVFLGGVIGAYFGHYQNPFVSGPSFYEWLSQDSQWQAYILSK
jgi:hypothetical protein